MGRSACRVLEGGAEPADDAGAFLGSYLNPLGYNPIFDVNEDGFVDSFDAGAFLGNYLKQRNLNGFVL